MHVKICLVVVVPLALPFDACAWLALCLFSIFVGGGSELQLRLIRVTCARRFCWTHEKCSPCLDARKGAERQIVEGERGKSCLLVRK